MEMNFRRIVTALAFLTLFAGLASAQFGSLATISCSVSVSATPTLSSESAAGKVGDIIITCGNSTATSNTSGSAADRGTLVVDFGTPVTSNVAANVANVGKPSEILALWNDPVGVALSGPVVGYGQNAAISVCTAVQSQGDQAAVIAGNNLAAAVTCPAFSYSVTAGGVFNAAGPYWVLDSTGAGGGQAKNAYQGAIGGSAGISFTANQVTFYNIPIIPSGSGSVTNKFRIVNARVNPGSLATITASLSTSPLAVSGNPVTGARWQYQLANSTATVATAAASLTVTTRSLGAVSLCTSSALVPAATQARANLSLVSFKENFAGAFKVRSLPLTAGGATLNDSQGAGAGQTRPDGTYTIAKVGAGADLVVSALNSETGVVTPNIGAAFTPALAMGQASTGTRLKAVFTSLDPNATYYASLTPVVDYATNTTFGVNSVTATTTGFAGDATQTPWAVLQAAGTAGGAIGETGAFAAAASVGLANGVVNVAAITRTATGTGEVVWEVTNTVPGTAQTLTFAIYAVYSNTVNPPSVSSTMNVGYAPTNTATAPGNQTNLPRYAALAASNVSTFFSVVPCQTALLFPYITLGGGYDTGIAISNTSKDPFSTATSEGACVLNFYGTNAPAAAINFRDASQTGTGAQTITAGSMAQNLVSILLSPAASFNGYGIATCNFQFAHGYGNIQAVAPAGQAWRLSTAYLALVMNTMGRGQALIAEGFQQ